MSDKTNVELPRIAFIDVGPASWGIKEFMVQSEMNRLGVKFLPRQVIKRILVEAAIMTNKIMGDEKTVSHIGSVK